MSIFGGGEGEGGLWTERTPSNTSFKMQQLSDKTTLSAGEEIQVISFSGGLCMAGGDSFIMNTSAAAQLGRVVIRIFNTELNDFIFFFNVSVSYCLCKLCDLSCGY